MFSPRGTVAHSRLLPVLLQGPPALQKSFKRSSIRVVAWSAEPARRSSPRMTQSPRVKLGHHSTHMSPLSGRIHARETSVRGTF